MAHRPVAAVNLGLKRKTAMSSVHSCSLCKFIANVHKKNLPPQIQRRLAFSNPNRKDVTAKALSTNSTTKQVARAPRFLNCIACAESMQHENLLDQLEFTHHYRTGVSSTKHCC